MPLLADDFVAIRTRLQELRRDDRHLDTSAEPVFLVKELAQQPVESRREAADVTSSETAERYPPHVVDAIKRRLYEIARRGH